MELFHRCFAPGVAVCLIYRKSALLLGQLLAALPSAGFIAEAIVVSWGCPGRAMRDSSSGVERLRIPRDRKSESAVVLVFVVPVILTSLFRVAWQPVESFCFGDANGGPAFRGPDVRPPRLLLALHGHIETFSKVPKRLYRLFDAPVSLGPFSSGRIRLGRLSSVGEPIGDRVGVDNLPISLGDPWSAQCAKAQGGCFVYLSFYSHFATVTRLGAVPLNLKGMNSPLATTARLGIFSRASLLP
ncbi:hypothetical protein CRG98_023369 [Punica granatum]|uniref:Uncharacterized protein n=1 Tax=Punica granatum TaxID=22663 RepID=A0A2I0JIZ4_PUNGR|nr:hypothetical protein CRG98_023369 [Punica granatum]